jgi:hypothetical protein
VSVGITYRAFLIVIVVLGAAYLFLARRGCACSPKYKAYITETRSDLRNLVTAEEGRSSRDSSFARNLDSLRFRASPGVHIVIAEAGRDGWSARARHDSLAGLVCQIFVGRVAQPLTRATGSVSEGDPVCDVYSQSLFARRNRLPGPPGP